MAFSSKCSLVPKIKKKGERELAACNAANRGIISKHSPKDP